jgi:uncharacterized protein (TIGR02145 family)
MKNLSIYFIFFFISGVSLTQSKKEMIAILTNRVDSLNQIVALERSDKQKLNNEISNLKIQIKELERNKENLSNDKSALETKNNTLNKQLKIKQDSLVLVTTELLKYRPAPKQELVVKQDITGPIKTVTIGKQVWMLENLNVSSFRNGVAIPEVQDEAAWIEAGDNHQPAWCYYDNDPKNGVKFGKLYNWYAVIDTNGLCPQGWHVPSYDEWVILVTYLGGKDVAGAKMKAKPIIKKEVYYYDVDTKVCSNCLRASEEYKKICSVCKGIGSLKIPLKKDKYVFKKLVSGFEGGTNECGFTGIPGGYRGNDGDYYYLGEDGDWWSSNEYNIDSAWGCGLVFDSGSASISTYGALVGFSVRCLKD